MNATGVSVFGLGYVGTVTCAVLSEGEHSVLGVDTNPQKVEAINQGKSPVFEPGVEALISAGRRNDRLRATLDPIDAVLSTDTSIICVGTPAATNGTADLGFVDAVFQQIATGIRQKRKPHTVCLRSTVPPGSTRSLAEKHFLSSAESSFAEVYFVPEFLREGTALNDAKRMTTFVIGTSNGEQPKNRQVASLFSDRPAFPASWEEAELTKYAFNAFHAMKVCFANEIGRLSRPFSLDARKVMDILMADTVLNISPYYLKPGNPYGGSCLPKDVAAIKQIANQKGIDVPLISSLDISNRLHHNLLQELVLSTGRRRICIIGLSFKSHTDDLRNSPMVALAEYLIGKGCEVTIFDPSLKPTALTGKNLSEAVKALPHLERLLSNDLQEAIEHNEVIVAALPVVDIASLANNVNAKHIVIDVNGWPGLLALEAKYIGLCW